MYSDYYSWNRCRRCGCDCCFFFFFLIPPFLFSFDRIRLKWVVFNSALIYFLLWVWVSSVLFQWHHANLIANWNCLFVIYSLFIFDIAWFTINNICPLFSSFFPFFVVIDFFLHGNSVNVCQSMSDKLVFKSVTPAGSCTAWNMESNLMVK